MPLRAIFNEQEILAPFLSVEEWEDMKAKKEKVILPCCQAQGYLRTSKRGIKHFVHQNKGECTSGKETWQHLLCKSEIALACKAMGYEVKTEASGIDWRADVLATKQGKNKLIKLAFEVQWSNQTIKQTEQRQEKYIRDGVRCCWLFKNLPSEQVRQDIPMFHLEFDEQEIPLVNVNGRIFKLFDFITALLSHHFQFCQFYQCKQQQNLKIRFFPIDCWKCHKIHYIYHVKNEWYRSICDYNLVDLGDGQENPDAHFRPEIRKKVDELLKTEQALNKKIKMGQIKSRYSKTVGESYLSFGCPHCDAIMGDHYYFEEIWEVENGYVEPIDFYTTINNCLLKKNIPHWCYSPSHNFCCRHKI